MSGTDFGDVHLEISEAAQVTSEGFSWLFYGLTKIQVENPGGNSESDLDILDSW